MSSQLDIFSPPPGDPPPYDTDCGWLYRLLADGRERSLTEILRKSFDERGVGLTVHSRISELRTRWGYTIEQRAVPGERRGNASAYRLVR